MNKKSLVIVESPTKAKTISRFVGKEYDVTSSMGHIRDLPKSKLGVDIDNNFEPTYIIPQKARKTVSELKSRAKSAASVILATDEDREGEAIAWHLANALGLDSKQTKRIVFHEITKPAIEAALQNPRTLDQKLVDAQQARRILDRLVGYQLSPFLWNKVMRGLSAGRVQSVAVRLIVEREDEIAKFRPQEYWTILADLSPRSGGASFTARLAKIGERPVKKFDLNSEQSANSVVQSLTGAAYSVASVESREIRRNPGPPFTTASLQQDCARKFGYTARQTMEIAQQLYEGIELGSEGSIGLITYMRTDSVNLAEQALAQIREAIVQNYGEAYALHQPRYYKSRSKNAQEAHEAIRPTDVGRSPTAIKPYLDSKQLKVYSLIWKRAIASQMKEAVFDQTTALIDAAPKSAQDHYTFRATGQTIKFDGFLKVYDLQPLDKDKNKEDEEDPESGVLPPLSAKQALDLIELKPKQSFTEPPPRYSDATLIKALEEAGIGRPSTYAPIITTILARKYVERKERRFYPTEIGRIVNRLLVEHFPQIVDLEFTANMEEGLDRVAEGEQEWQPLLAKFYEPFRRHLEEKLKSVEKHTEESQTPCPHCGKPMLIKFGRLGKFLACPDPESKITQPMPEEVEAIKSLEEKTKDERCPLCTKPMAVKRGRFGYFLGCTNYPECKGIMKIWNKTGYKCPNCIIGEVVEKKSRGRGKPFYACNRYPDCQFITNKKPESEAELTAALEYWKANPPKPKAEKKYGKRKKSE